MCDCATEFQETDALRRNRSRATFGDVLLARRYLRGLRGTRKLTPDLQEVVDNRGMDDHIELTARMVEFREEPAARTDDL
jgi:hypothetical protein